LQILRDLITRSFLIVRRTNNRNRFVLVQNFLNWVHLVFRADAPENLIDELIFRHTAFNADFFIRDGEWHGVDLVLVGEFRKLGCFDRIRCNPFAFHCHLVSQTDCTWTMRSGRR